MVVLLLCEEELKLAATELCELDIETMFDDCSRCQDPAVGSGHPGQQCAELSSHQSVLLTAASYSRFERSLTGRVISGPKVHSSYLHQLASTGTAARPSSECQPHRVFAE